MRNALWTAALSLALVTGLTGCATKKYVQTQTGAVNTRVDQVQGQVEQAQTKISEHDQHLQKNDQTLQAHEQQMGQISQTAQDALNRATEAGKLAEGKFLSETILTDDKVKFGFNKNVLSKEAKAALDEFANQIASQNQNVYIEIQGYTDNVGSKTYNEELGEKRAEAVRQYLSQEHKFPLHRINVISYGESSPIADNHTRQGRAQNRRVALVVLR
jgi:peptidoglycan-associated lipoprotein